MDGITNDVLIMPVKAVPDGDERDKDVALAIRYAVDNGAQIINMSFGKGYSPHKKWVDDAVRYAEKHDVLLVHAAGNDGTDNDSIPSYPNPFFEKNGKRADNFITVGASGPTDEDGHLAASFSNYGKKEVDLFAPGVNIYSTLPGNKYGVESGTSMASPVVTGVAALVLEYYPTLTAKQLRWVLDHSVTKLDSVQVTKPGSNVKVPFSSLCISGGIVNAYNALKLGATIDGKRKIK
jgi:subtilisin family serine protease